MTCSNPVLTEILPKYVIVVELNIYYRGTREYPFRE